MEMTSRKIPAMFARRVFRVAGIYGLIVLLPQYFLEGKISRDRPPAITHPEFFYGFLGVALAWQIAFLIVSTNPVKYRVLMLPGILEKIGFGVAAVVLYLQQRTDITMAAAGGIDLAWAVLFAMAYWTCRGNASPEA